ncbi:MAG: hypothetical protein KY461_02550 [Actinobacteria bacterium]|nr:hypothetical protein [Actinomycetota bacterium]
MTSRRVPARSVVAVLTLVVGAAVTATPARGQDGCDGVQVVVDATALGGGLTSRCLAGDPDTGLEALREAGHTYTFVPRQPGLVCTIDTRPDPCNGAPEDAYWSYWHAPAGGSWTYSTRGAGTYDPEPGEVEGWAFGAGDPPREPPPAAGADDPAPEPTEEPEPAEEPAGDPTPPTDDDGDDGDDGTPDPGDETGAISRDASPTAGAVTTGPSPTVPDQDTTQAASPSELEDPPGPVEPASASPSASPLAGDVIPSGGGGAPVGLLAGGLLIVGLAGAGVVQARRRDRA